MRLIDDLGPLDALATRPVGEVLRDFFGEPDHRFAPALVAEPRKRDRLFFIDALVHGLAGDPPTNWAPLAGARPPRGTPVEALFRSRAQSGQRVAAWIDANERALPRRVWPSDEIASWQKLPLEEIAARLGLTAPPEMDAAPGGDRRREIWRAALLLQAATGLLPRLLDFHPPCVPLVFSCDDDRGRAWQAALDATRHREGVPLVVVEPFDFWKTADVSALEERAALFVFGSKNDLWHALAIPRMFPLLLATGHAVLVADTYAGDDVLRHFAGRDLSGTVFPVFQPSHPAWSGRLEAMAEAAAGLLRRAVRGEPAAGVEARWLFELGRNLQAEVSAMRYGAGCAAQLRRLRGNEQWFNPHKEWPPADKPTFPPADLFDEVLREVVRPPRPRLAAKPRYRVTHVVPQIVDQSHAPSALLRLLVDRAHRARWEPAVLSLEANVIRPGAYPRDVYRSESSRERAPDTLAAWRAQGVASLLCGADAGPDEAVAEAVRWLAGRETDVAVFHGNDPLLLLTAARCSVPRRVFVEHSGMEFQRDFDLAISPLANAAEAYLDLSRRTGVAVASLPYASTARDTWQAGPPDFGVGPAIKILTTISNHLETRVAGPFVEAVATILQICPNAVYAPIGTVRDAEAFRDRFAPWGVRHRIMCIGGNRAPSQLCRGMHLYLNEFPFGSGIAILDAMAAGLPVVTMYDPSGPLQAQNGGNYLGVGHAITSLDPVDYVVRACELLQDPEKHRSSSEHSLRRYEQFGPERYARDFEALLESHLVPGEV